MSNKIWVECYCNEEGANHETYLIDNFFTDTRSGKECIYYCIKTDHSDNYQDVWSERIKDEDKDNPSIVKLIEDKQLFIIKSIQEAIINDEKFIRVTDILKKFELKIKDKPKNIESYLIKVKNKHIILCPFHEEKTGSFVVFVKEGTYHCFSCNKYGSLTDLSDEEFASVSSQLKNIIQV